MVRKHILATVKQLDGNFCLQIDESKCKYLEANLVNVILIHNGPSILLDSYILSKSATSFDIEECLLKSQLRYGFNYAEINFIITDAASYMLKAINHLSKVLFIGAEHLICIGHILHNVCVDLMKIEMYQTFVNWYLYFYIII